MRKSEQIINSIEVCVCMCVMCCAVHCAYVTCDGNLHECKFSLYHIISAGCELVAANLSGCMRCICIGILLVKLNQSINVFKGRLNCF